MQNLCTAPTPVHGEVARDAVVASTMHGADVAEAGGTCATGHGDTNEASTDAARVSDNACGQSREASEPLARREAEKLD